MLRELAVAVLDHHDGRIDEHANGEREAAERHDVRADLQVVHRDEGCNHGNRQSEYGNQRRAEMKKEDDDDDANDKRFF